jgi:hypothetical protein
MIYTIQDDMPNRNKMILGTSTFWILNSIYYFYLKQQYFQMLLLSSIAIASPIFWYNYEINSIAHKCDFYFSLITFIYTIVRYHKYIYTSDIILLIKFYILSMLLTIYKEYELQLYSHLLFRCYFYKILYLAINDDGYDYRLYYDISKFILNNMFLFTFTDNNNFNLITYGLYSSQTIIILFI